MTVTDQLNEKYPQHIIEYVRQRFGLESDDTSKDDKILRMSKGQVFKEVVNWNGLLGSYDQTIKYWILDIYDIDLDEVE